MKNKRKKSYLISKKRIITLICIIMLVLFEIVAFKNSRANKIIEITASIIDDAQMLEVAQIKLEAANSGASGYYLTLPEYIENKKVGTYFIEEKNINQDEETGSEEEENQEDESLLEEEASYEITQENLEENVQENEQIDVQEEKEQVNTVDDQTETVSSESSNIIKKQPGEVLYLTQTEVEEQSITLTVSYNYYEKNEQVLYEQRIQTEIDDDEDGTNDTTIIVDGYMPLGSVVSATNVYMETIEDTIKNELTNKISFKRAYDIKIMYNGIEFEPTDFDTNVKVSILGMDEIDEQNQQYKVIHIEDDSNVEEIQGVQTTNTTLSFPAEKFSTYAILLEDGLMATSLYSADMSTASVWDGSSASSFRFGSGTSAEPYLITNAKELAYLATQVNGGTSYDGTYFELIADIDLNNLEWTPIGDYENSFKGVFNGAGHTIANAIISLPTSMPTSVTSYGIFGSIGDSTNKTTIKNLQLDNINIELNAQGTTGTNNTAKGYNIGIVTGTIFNNAEIKNVIVNNSSILDNYAITLSSNTNQFFIGGIAGLAVNSATSTTDPGANYRYSIENCYSSTNINLDIAITTRGQAQTYVAAQYAVGGIIGGIRSQAVWPTNCLYTGELNATNAFTGPIFGYLRNNTNLPNSNNTTTLNTLWQGNDAGNLTMESYYTGYSTNGQSFTITEESGTSSSRITTNTGTATMQYVQGVNKGIYTNSAQNMLSNFNTYVTNNSAENYMTWYYDTASTAYYFVPNLSGTVQQNSPTYTVVVNDESQTGTYTYSWYIDGEQDTTITGNSITMESNWTDEYVVEVLISNGDTYAMVSFEVPTLEIHISFEKDNTENTLTAGLEGTGTADSNFNLNDYTYQWYIVDIADGEEIIDGATTNTLTDIDSVLIYKVVATNTQYSYMSTEGTYDPLTRVVIYCSYSDGNDTNDGFTPETPVKTLATAYGKFEDETSRDENIIVLMGTYTSYSDILNSATSTTFNKNVTITGKYQGTDYSAILYFQGTSSSGYKYLNGNTTFMYLTFYGSNSQTYLYLQGYSLTMGEGIVMSNYANAASNQGLIDGTSPAFHVFAGWLQYDETRLPRTDSKVVIKSGTYSRILLGGSPGASNATNLQKNNSHNFIGSSLTDDLYKCEITIDINNSTTSSNYAYDVNLLCGGSACGNMYGDITINIKNGTVGRLLGASIGNSSYRPNNWDYPINTFIGYTTINMSGGSVTEMYGGCLGRNMLAIEGNTTNPIACDSYFYGIVNINISGGTVIDTIYGAGAGGVSGYNENSSDEYKSYGQGVDTVININISGGTINADIYGGGYGYTNYLTANSTQPDAGTLYGDCNITISGSPTINGNIYGGGRGYDLSSDKTELAQTIGTSTITISGSPTITGNIYGAGMGVSGYENMAMLTGNTNVNINSDLSTNVFGGGNIAKTVGNTFININSGTHSADIYGGGNVGILEGTATVTINGGIQNAVYGGGKSADVTNSIIYIKGGTNTNVYGGGNEAGAESTTISILGGDNQTVYGGSNQSGDVTTTTINATGGTCTNIFGGNNEGGTCSTTNVTIDGVAVTEAVYGGGNKVATEETNVVLISSDGEISYIFGGGKAADATTTNVTVNSGTALNIFGGSNTSGTVTNSNVTINSGTITNVYGGNNEGGTTITSNVVTEGGTVTNLYGGGNQANTDTSNVTINDGKITNTFGGANQADVTTANVNVIGGVVESTFGGSNQSGTVSQSNITVDGGTIANVYGGNNLGGTNTNSNVIINDGTVTDVYGGGNQAVTNAPQVTIQNNATITGSVYGGGNQAAIETSTKVDILGGTIFGNVYGGGNEGTVTNDTYVHVKDATLQASLYAGGNRNTSNCIWKCKCNSRRNSNQHIRKCIWRRKPGRNRNKYEQQFSKYSKYSWRKHWKKCIWRSKYVRSLWKYAY